MNRVGTVVPSTTPVVGCCDTDDESFFYCPECAQLRWLQRFIDERLPPLAEVALAASALAELRHGKRSVGIETLKRLLHRG